MGFRLDNGDDLLEMMKLFTITKNRNDFVSVNQVNEAAFVSGISKSKAKARLKMMGAVQDKNCCVGGVVHGRGFLGVKLNQLDAE